MRITARCECCNGSGQRPLTVAEAETLPLVGLDWTSANAIAAALDFIGRGAVCNRLVRMEDAGLVESRLTRGSRLKEWRRKP